MLNSMTGFGRAEASGAGVAVTVEIRSGNNRFRDVQVRCPREYAPLEPRILAAVKARVGRGRIEVNVRRAATGSRARVSIDRGLARGWHDALVELAAELDGVSAEMGVEVLAALPGVAREAKEDTDPTAEWPVLEAALSGALDHLAAMRQREGAALAADLESHLELMRDHRQKVELEASGVASRLQLRLLDRVNKLVADRADPARIAQEAALLADKADVSEELARLASHCRQFQAALARPGPVGRRLEFITQEMNREINTIGSKAAEHPVSALVVEMKSTLERIREQVANVE